MPTLSSNKNRILFLDQRAWTGAYPWLAKRWYGLMRFGLISFNRSNLSRLLYCTISLGWYFMNSAAADTVASLSMIYRVLYLPGPDSVKSVGYWSAAVVSSNGIFLPCKHLSSIASLPSILVVSISVPVFYAVVNASFSNALSFNPCLALVYVLPRSKVGKSVQ